MRKEWFPALLLTLACLLLLNGGYTALLWGLAQLRPGRGNAAIVAAGNGRYYYRNLAQRFTQDRYCWPRPSAVAYNAAGSGGSNLGPTNPALLRQVEERTAAFLARNPVVRREEVPAELVTASGSGLDPDLSPAAVAVQTARIAAARGWQEEAVRQLAAACTERSLFGLGPDKINVLQFNLALDSLQAAQTRR
jgi:potassium-transporting ATPase KdpC subunit